MKKNNKIFLSMLIFVYCICVIFNDFCIANNNINVYAKSYISYERNTKTVLFGKNIDVKIPMASTTKIMTAILLLEYGNLDEYATASKKAENTNGQQLKLKEGDKITLNDLLYAIMLYSANDGAIVIAEHIGGNVENFCNMMNEKAKKIGALNTNFTSPHGLDNKNHYSTPYDLALITDYALNIPKFKEITSTKTYTIKISGNDRNINNTNKLLNIDSEITGTKTGYTNNALYCLVANKVKNDKDIIVVILGANSSKQRFDEAKKIIDFSIENYEIIDINNYIKKHIIVNVNNGKEKSIILNPEFMYKICILRKDKENISVNYYILDNIYAPVKKGDLLAVGYLKINNDNLLKIKYIADDNISEINYFDYFFDIILNISNYLKIK